MKTFLPILILLSFLLNTSICMGQTGKSKPAQKFYERNNRHGFKVSLSSLLNDVAEYIEISYEYAKKDRRSYQFSAGILGLSDNNTLSYFVRGGGGLGAAPPEIISYPQVSNGIFFKASTRYYTSSMKPKHFRMAPSVFRGFYLEPEFIFGFYQRNFFDYTTTAFPGTSSFFAPTPELVTKNINYQAFFLNFGRQGVLERVVLLDFNLGIGFALDNLENIEENRNISESSFFYPVASNLYNHGVITKRNGGLSVALNFSLRVGGIF